MLKKIGFVLFLAVIFIVGAASVLASRIVFVALHPTPSFTPQLPTFTFQPPHDSLVGELASASGNVQKEGLNDQDFATVSAGQRVLESDEYTTDASSSALVRFDALGSVQLDPTTDLQFASTNKNTFLVRHLGGTVIYSAQDGQTQFPLTIRIAHFLVTLTGGTLQVSRRDVNSDVIKLAVVDGKVQVAVVDLKNDTQVYVLQASQSAVLSDKKRSVTIE